MIRIFLCFLAFSGVALSVHAQDANLQGPEYDEAREAEIARRAKKRIYPGGRDEEELRVQAQVTNPVRKLAPQADLHEESSEE